MELLILFIISLGLAMDCFSMGITNSSVSGLVKPGVPLKTALIFALSHLVFFLGGHRLGLWFQSMAEGVELWIAFIIFTIIGLKMISETRRRKPEARVVDINNFGVMLMLSLAISIDAFLVGIALGIAGTPFLMAAGLIIFSVFVFTLGGMVAGKNFGLPFAKRIGIFGGIFMFVAAFSFLANFIF